MAVFAPRYARAFASVAESTHMDVAAAEGQMRDFADTLAGSDDLREVLMNPSIPSEQKLGVIDAIAGRLGMVREVRNFLAVIMEHGRLGALNEILSEYHQMADADSGFAEAEITSAHPLAEEQKAQLEAEAAKLAGCKVRATYTEDASLLGGAVVKIGSTVYDGSVRAQLAEMKRRLVTA
jgi:F-type H+-transporting ATPase subunit delta